MPMSVISFDEVQKYFHLPSKQAAAQLGIGTSSLKKICRRNGLHRWPHRKIKSLHQTLSTLPTLDGTSPTNSAASLSPRDTPLRVTMPNYLAPPPSPLGVRSPSSSCHYASTSCASTMSHSPCVASPTTSMHMELSPREHVSASLRVPHSPCDHPSAAPHFTQSPHGPAAAAAYRLAESPHHPAAAAAAGTSGGGGGGESMHWSSSPHENLALPLATSVGERRWKYQTQLVYPMALPYDVEAKSTAAAAATFPYNYVPRWEASDGAPFEVGGAWGMSNEALRLEFPPRRQRTLSQHLPDTTDTPASPAPTAAAAAAAAQWPGQPQTRQAAARPQQ